MCEAQITHMMMDRLADMLFLTSLTSMSIMPSNAVQALAAPGRDVLTGIMHNTARKHLPLSQLGQISHWESSPSEFKRTSMRLVNIKSKMNISSYTYSLYKQPLHEFVRSLRVNCAP